MPLLNADPRQGSRKSCTCTVREGGSSLVVVELFSPTTRRLEAAVSL
jgi:hypothetical protein